MMMQCLLHFYKEKGEEDPYYSYKGNKNYNDNLQVSPLNSVKIISGPPDQTWFFKTHCEGDLGAEHFIHALLCLSFDH